MDDIDYEIVQTLCRDGRTTNIELAGRTGITEGAVRRRIRNLVSQGIITVVGVANPEKTGYGVSALLAVQTHPTKVVKVGEQLAQEESVRWVIVAAGEYDLFVSAVFRSNDDLLQFVTSKLGAMAGVRRIQTFPVFKILKRPHEWIPRK